MQTITAIVETPKGSAQKYDYDKKNKWFKLKKIMPAGMVFPFDFGFIPGTKGEDGDPLDIVIISEFKSFPGCAMDCRLIGGILAQQTEKNKKIVRNDRFIAIPQASQMFAAVKSINDLPKDIIDQLKNFFINYNEQEGKKFRPLKNINSTNAYKLIKSN
jgi:inorganic pyrophosphatase